MHREGPVEFKKKKKKESEMKWSKENWKSVRQFRRKNKDSSFEIKMWRERRA